MKKIYSPKVSVLVITYNQQDYFKECLDSVINQTYLSWEAIIIDDNSTDKTSEIIKPYLLDPRIKYIKHITNWGVNKLVDTYNQALRMARGEYIAILEGDDMWPLNKLEKQIIDFKENKDLVLSFGDWTMINSKDLPFNIDHYHNFDHDNLSNKPIGSILYEFYKLKFYIISPTVMIRKSALVNIGGFQKCKHYPYVDIPTYQKLALVGTFKYHSEVLGVYRKHSKSTWFQRVKASKSIGRNELIKCFNSFYTENKRIIQRKKLFFNKYKKFQEKYINYKEGKRLITLIYHSIVFNNDNNVKKYFEQVFKSSRANLFYRAYALVIFVSFLLLGNKLLKVIFLLKSLNYKVNKLIN
jgi:glycosyltransferase involved in cell wall biosynthesis